MSRAFYVPPQSVNAVGNSEFLDILVTTFFALLERRHRCTRRCCGRSYLRPNYIASAQDGTTFSPDYLYARSALTIECTRVSNLLDTTCYSAYNWLRYAYRFHMNPFFEALATFKASYVNFLAKSGLNATALSQFTDYVNNTIEPSFSVFEGTNPSFEEQVLMSLTFVISFPLGGGCGGTQCSYAIVSSMQTTQFLSQLNVVTVDNDQGPVSEACRIKIIKKYIKAYTAKAEKMLLIINNKKANIPTSTGEIEELILKITEYLNDLSSSMNNCDDDADLHNMNSFVSGCSSDCINTYLDELSSKIPMTVQQVVSDTMMEISGDTVAVDFTALFTSTCS